MPPSPTYFRPDPGQVYQPAEDSFLILRAAREEIKPEDRVLEIGIGSGYVSSRLPPCRMVIGTDINPHAVRIAGETGLRVIRTDLSAGLRGIFDLILFNPPYLPTMAVDRIDDWLEYALDGGETGREVISRFLVAVGDSLAPGGRILLLISSLTGKEETLQMIHQTGWTAVPALEELVEGGEMLFVYRLTR